MSTRGREAESSEIEQLFQQERPVQGVGFRVRWREDDGATHQKTSTRHGLLPSASLSRVYFVQAMVWVRRDGQLQGEWSWEAYDRDYEWDQDAWSKVNRWWLDMGYWSVPKSNAGSSIPLEILLCMLEESTLVCPAFREVSGAPSHCFAVYSNARCCVWHLPCMGHGLRTSLVS